MADGSIVIDIQTNDSGVKKLNKSLSSLEEKYTGAFQDKNGRWRDAKGRFLTMREQSEMLGKSIEKIDGKSQKASKGIKDIALGLGLVKIASVAFDIMKKSLDAAISRFDTMQKYPKVMSALGFGAKESERSVKKLASGIEGLPTRLNDVVSTAQRMTSVTGNLKKSTDATLALNNAMLASGASTSDANRGMEQYIQMLSTGKVDMQSWRTLQETMPIGLQKTAEAMGFVGRTAQNDLYNALKKGTITFDQFQDKLIELGTGTGELAKLAKINSQGIATSFENLKNAAVKGIANVMEAFDRLAVAVTGKTIAQNLDLLKGVINLVFDGMVNAINGVIPLFKGFSTIIVEVLKVIQPLAPTLLTIVTAMASLMVIQKVTQAFYNSELAIRLYLAGTKALEVAIGILTLATNSQARAELLKNIQSKASNAIAAISLARITAQNVIMGILTGTTSLATVATTAFSAAIKLLLGPIGWVTAAIGALVGAGIALWNWLNKESEETKVLRGEQEALLKSTDDLIKKSEENASSRKDETNKLKESQASYRSLIEEMDLLSSKEKLSNDEKKRMGEIVEDLNGKLGGLNLVYDEQANKLSEQPEKIQKQIDAFHALDEASSAQERINEMLKERNDNEAKLMQINMDRERWNETLKESGGNTKEARENIEKLDEKEKELQVTQNNLSQEIIQTAASHEEAMQRASIAVESGVLEQTVSYEALQGKNKEVMDAMRSEYQALEEKAGNAFDAIQQKTAISTDQMIENLQKNQASVDEWSKNIKILAERGVDEGLIEQLRKMGPEGATQAAELVRASDEKLQQLNEVFSKTPETALNGMKEAYQLGKNGVNDEVATIIPSQKETLTSQLAQANFKDIGKSVTEDVASGIENGREKVAEMTKGIVSDSQEKAKKEVKAADFLEIGLSIPQGMEKGVEDGKEKPLIAVTGMTDDIVKGAKNSLDTHSPSKVFEDIGKNVAEGLALGVETNKKGPLESIRQLAEQLMQTMESFPDQTRSIGVNAMQGLANGIYEGSQNALNAAQEVANRITNSIQKALEIHSPSRVMRDKVGKFIPQGIAVGIKKDTTKVLDAAEDLSKVLYQRISPEMALSGMNPGFVSSTSTVNNHTTKTIQHAPTINITIDKAELSSEQSLDEFSRKLGQKVSREIDWRME